MGEVFAGRYELADPIGRGGVGAVWRAWDHRRRRYVAAKVLQQSDAHSLLRFVREQALRIDHPHVLAPASWAADDDKVLFTMDLVTGGSLVHLVGDYGPLPPAFVCTLLDQLLAGLAAVHAEGVVHRDIKPANVLLEATGTARPRLRLSDFGIAMRLGEPRLTETNYVVGTPGYFAPEQMMGSDPDFPADLFAVGLVALYLLEGAKPDTKALVEHFAASGTPGAPRGIPEPLWQVVATLLQPDPHARFRTATGARKALASAAELLPEPGPDDELVEVFDQIGPLPPGFAPKGPLRTAPGLSTGALRSGSHPASGEIPGHATGSSADADSASGSGHGPARRQPGPGTFSQEVAAGHVRPVPLVGNVPPKPSGMPATGDMFSASAPASTPSHGALHGASGGAASGPSTMSDTGSFHLPPPQLATPRPERQPQSPPPSAPRGSGQLPAPRFPPHRPVQPATPPKPVALPPAPFHAPPFEPTYVPVPEAASPAVPVVRQPASAPSAPQDRSQPGGRRRARRRPGPPAKVVVPVLLLALGCFAVGFWALTRI
ncbi:protein kinase [Streptomyces sp. NPDC008313]|uniref:serine/threonine protein kinase n=1 Tax=Streptomyces sp. NPDC008313 TaxID=3364826 RepID=UPI0036E9BDD9